MKTNKKKKKYTRIDGVLYEAITSNYDGRVIGWGKVYDVSNANGLLGGTLIIKPNKGRWGIYYIK